MKYCRPISNREDYLAIRNSAEQVNYLKRIRIGREECLKNQLVQFNYSCLPNEDGSLKGSTRLSSTVGMDVDHIEVENMQEVKERILSKKEELGLLMLEVSARRQGYHLVFRRKPELTQEENLKWASDLLGVEYDQAAKDITRVFFTTSASEEDLIYLDDEIFEIKEVQAPAETNAVANAETQVPETPTVSEAAPVEAEGVNLQAFDEIVEKVGLNLGRIDHEGQRHNNLLSILSYGLPKLMDRKQVEAVIKAKMPSYSQTDDCWKTLDFFYKQYKIDTGFMQKDLREIYSQMQRDKENGEECVMDSLIKGWNPPPMPEKLPRLIKLLIKPFPKQYHPILAVS